MNRRAYANMYEAALEGTWELFSAYLDGARTAPLLAVSASALGGPARAALTSTAASLGYGDDACAFATLACADATGGPALDRQALFTLVEGLDPLGLIVTDSAAARAVAEAYRCSLALGESQRVFGRPCVAFESFEPMLATSQDKQKAWALLKRLPKYPPEVVP